MSGKKYYVGQTPEQMLRKHRGGRYFYGIKTDGENLFIERLDALNANDLVIINEIGDDPTADFPRFNEEEDFFEGRDEQHRSRYGNLRYEQWKWSDAPYQYYIDDNGELTLRIYQAVDEGEILIPDVPLNPIQIDYRRQQIFVTLDNTSVTFDNTVLTFDNEEPN